MSTILEISDSVKDSASDKYGEPPYGHAEASSLKMFTTWENLDLDKSMELLIEEGMTFDGPQDRLKAIAKTNNRSPQQIYEIIKPALKIAEPETKSVTARFPDAPESGWGKKKLSDACDEYGLDLSRILKQLGDKGLVAEAEMNIKDIAAVNDMDPMGVFEALHEIVTSNC
jgi:hypothetical protein